MDGIEKIDYKEKIKEIRTMILNASYEAGACHIGSALSSVKILVDIFYNKMKPGDIFLHGKATGVATYYSILADKGFFPKEKVSEYLKRFPLPSKEVPGVIHGFGSCGHGLSVACGAALGDRARNVYVLLSDGECQEGSTLEAVQFAGHHKLDNLFVYVDENEYQALGRTEDILSLKTTFDFMKKTLPNCEIVRTVKGAGVDFMGGQNSWHYRNLTKELLDKALAQI